VVERWMDRLLGSWAGVPWFSSRRSVGTSVVFKAVERPYGGSGGVVLMRERGNSPGVWSNQQ